jgi:hypothetical protein
LREAANRRIIGVRRRRKAGGSRGLAGDKALKWRAIVFAAAVAAAFSSSSAGAVPRPLGRAPDRDCSVPTFHFNPGGETFVTMSVRSGVGCQFHFEVIKSTKGLAGILSSTTTVRPKNGLLGKNTVRIYAYMPNPNFVGNDEFEISIQYDRDNGEGPLQTLLKVNVTVY